MTSRLWIQCNCTFYKYPRRHDLCFARSKDLTAPLISDRHTSINHILVPERFLTPMRTTRLWCSLSSSFLTKAYLSHSSVILSHSYPRHMPIQVTVNLRSRSHCYPSPCHTHPSHRPIQVKLKMNCPIAILDRRRSLACVLAILLRRPNPNS